MEVLLETPEGQSTSQDMYLSMRIGDVQKQSRLASKRTYRFPDPGDSRKEFGRIEVYKRVGQILVNFSSIAGQFQDVEVPCELPGLLAGNKLTMRLAVTGPAGEKGSPTRPDSPEQTKKGRTKARLDAAQQYLVEHRLEDLLAECMRQVIAAKPKDPHAFLSKQILSRAPHPPEAVEKALVAPAAAPPEISVEDIRMQARNALLQGTHDGSLDAAIKAAAEMKGTQAAASPANTVKELRMQARKALLQGTHDGSLDAAMKAAAARKAKQDAAALSANARDAPAKGWAGYYKENLTCLEPGAFSALYAKFDSAPKKLMTEPRPSADKPTDWCGYYTANFASLNPGDLAKLYANFKSGPQKSIVAAVGPSPSQAMAKPFRMKPSVGTWLTLRSRKVQEAVPAGEDCEVVQFCFKPSVGTWLMQKPARTEVLEGNGSSTLKVEDRSVVPFLFKPSVGSWLMQKPLEEPAAKPFAFRPSVGSWLMQKPLADASKSGDDLGASILFRHQNSLLGMSTEDLVKTFHAEMKRKDDEIAELKRKLGM